MSLGEFPYYHPHHRHWFDKYALCVYVYVSVRAFVFPLYLRTPIYIGRLLKPSCETRNTVNREQIDYLVVCAQKRECVYLYDSMVINIETDSG